MSHLIRPRQGFSLFRPARVPYFWASEPLPGIYKVAEPIKNPAIRIRTSSGNASGTGVPETRSQ